jgi:Arc/MetJ-type ribon-helix-helix transcriptional regulator
MAALTIRLPDDLRDFVDRRTPEAQLPSPGDYIGALIREDQIRCREEQLEKRLLAGLDSGSPIPIEDPDAYLARKKESLLARMQRSARP